MPSIVAAVSAAYSAVTATVIGKALVQLGVSVALSLLAQALAPRPNQKQQLSIPNSRPPKRFVYGRFRTVGTPAPWRVRKRVLYGCIILNSRPSAGGDVKIFMDKRACFGGSAAPSDVFDFNIGALLDPVQDFKAFPSASNARPRVWIGLGTQTAPPQQILDEVGPGGTELAVGQDPLFETTDGWTGLTVMWVRLDAGPADDRQKRWRAVPPEFEVEMDWSLVYDPRDNGQDPDDPDTWTFSNNQALVYLDGLRQNPIRQYPLRQIHLPSIIEAADVADEDVDLYHASVDANVWTDPDLRLKEPRYTANGILVWAAGELADQLSPIAQAGASEIVRIGGQVGLAAGEYRPPILTVTDIIQSGGIDYQRYKPGRELPRFVKGGYVSPARDWQEAELTPLTVAGASGGVGDDGILEVFMPFVTSATQAMRIQQIIARQLSRQKTLSVTLWPEAVNLASGATIATNFAVPFSRLNGEWTVVAANPGVWTSEMDEEIAVRVPVSLRQNDAQVWTWVPETDEQVVVNTAFDPTRLDTSVPGNLTVQTGDGFSTPTQARLFITFDPVPGADYYEISVREDGGEYEITVERTENTAVSVNVDAGVIYDVRVVAIKFIRTPLSDQNRSDPAEVFGTLAAFGAEAAPDFEPVIAGGPLGRSP